MLAAAPDSNSMFGLIHVVLASLAQRSKISISDSLKDHLFKVLQDAFAIASNPILINRDTSVEALELALRIRKINSLMQQISAIHSFEGIQADVAEKLLKSISHYAT